MRVRLSKLELIAENEIESLAKDDLVSLAKTWRTQLEELQGLVFRMRRHQFGRRSEKSERSGEEAGEETPAASTPRADTTKLPSKRYPEAQLREDKIKVETVPLCPLCGETMQDSGMTEDSEYIDVQSKEFYIVEQKRPKFRCTCCHGGISTPAAPPRVTPGGAYSDSLIVDATLSKYCDLIPIERYCQMAGRGGFSGLPPHSLIQASHRLAEFLQSVYLLIKTETLNSHVLLADETPHRMLEGDPRSGWYLWGFSNGNMSACFFECHDSRSGDVSIEVLKMSICVVLMSDAYRGYSRSIRETNEFRAKHGLPPIAAAYCNAHARRQFLPGEVDIEDAPEDVKTMVKHYKEIYKLEAAAKGLSDDGVLEKRAEMRPHFESLRQEAIVKVGTYSDKSVMGRAYAYFLKYYDNLTLFLANPKVPIDNNASERLLRSHVVGRKTWYGTHSRRGAATAAIHFSIVETCKLNGINPREYYLDAINRIHQGKEPITPRQYKERLAEDAVGDNDTG